MADYCVLSIFRRHCGRRKTDTVDTVFRMMDATTVPTSPWEAFHQVSKVDAR